MNLRLFYNVLFVLVLPLTGCRKADPVPAAAEEAVSVSDKEDGVSLAGMSREQREAHRIRQTVGFLDEALAALTALERKEQLTWKSVPKPDLAAFAATLTSVRSELAQSEENGAQSFHNQASGRLDDVFQQILQLSQQTTMPEGAPESREFAGALIGASDAMDTTSEVRDIK